MFSSEFTCERCGYRSEHLLMVCPECGLSASYAEVKKPEPETDAVGNYTPAQMEKWTGVSSDPVIKADSNLKLLKGLKATALAGVFVFILMYLPCFVIPIATGPDSTGRFTFPSRKGNKPPMKMTAGGMTALNLGNTAIIIICAGCYFYFKRKTDEAETETEASDTRIF